MWNGSNPNNQATQAELSRGALACQTFEDIQQMKIVLDVNSLMAFMYILYVLALTAETLISLLLFMILDLTPKYTAVVSTRQKQVNWPCCPNTFCRPAKLT